MLVLESCHGLVFLVFCGLYLGWWVSFSYYSFKKSPKPRAVYGAFKCQVLLLRWGMSLSNPIYSCRYTRSTEELEPGVVQQHGESGVTRRGWGGGWATSSSSIATGPTGTRATVCRSPRCIYQLCAAARRAWWPYCLRCRDQHCHQQSK